jgi:thioredoxin 1
MNVKSFKIAVILSCLLVMFLFARQAALAAAEHVEIPVKGMVTMVDFGSKVKSCIPCQIMAPILEKLKKEYAGRAAVIFLDIRENQEEVDGLGVQTIPLQIFFDKDGREVFRHVGVFREEAIIEQFKKMGVKKG